MNTAKMLSSFFIYFAHSIIGIIFAKRSKLHPLIGAVLGFLFVPIFFNFLPLISERMSRKS